MPYDKILKLATNFEKLVLAQETMPGSVGAYQELLAGYGTWAKYTGGKNLTGQLIDSGQLDFNNPTISSVFDTMESVGGQGEANAQIYIKPNMNVIFKVTGSHPAVKNGAITNTLNKSAAPAMYRAITAAVKSKAIMAPTAEAPIYWNWFTGLRTA